MIYLASPYLHEDAGVRDSRFIAVSDMLGRLIASGMEAYSPIAMTHTAAKMHALPKNYEFWHTFNCNMIDACSELWVTIDIDGWRVSRGIQAEVDYALGKGKEVWTVSRPLNGGPLYSIDLRVRRLTDLYPRSIL